MRLTLSGHVAHYAPRPLSFAEAANLTPVTDPEWRLLDEAMGKVTLRDLLPSTENATYWVILKDAGAEPLLGHLHLVGCTFELLTRYDRDPVAWKTIHVFTDDIQDVTPMQMVLLRWAAPWLVPDHPLYRALRLELPECWLAFDAWRVS